MKSTNERKIAIIEALGAIGEDVYVIREPNNDNEFTSTFERLVVVIGPRAAPVNPSSVGH
ncbi:MAG: hypothetical protein A2001_01610 [Treponema sp. GWC1_61_84]|nr:MAG: hypothetical protein A2001_01610 [Treponema sp. GWC1_61_84]